MMTQLAVVFFGGGVGALSRFGLSMAASGLNFRAWTGTLIGNLLGCFLFFLISARFPEISKSGKLFVQVGFLGALTTFSTFSYEIVTLLKTQKYIEAMVVLFLNVFFGIIIGVWVFRHKLI